MTVMSSHSQIQQKWKEKKIPIRNVTATDVQ